jgi:hypothetical protein
VTGYPVLCSTPGCGQTAIYKIASIWSDGITRDLKTYYLSCKKCVKNHEQAAKLKQEACRLAEGETLLPPERIAR